MATSRRHRPSVALATCALVPDLDEDDRLVIAALADRGVAAVPAVWDDSTVDWEAYDLIVVRSAWDYAERRTQFLAWSGSLRRVLNSQAVLAWNTDKVYLRDLAARGIGVVPTIWADPGTEAEEIALPEGELVVKPAVSAGARNAARYHAHDHAAARSHVGRLLAEGRTVMVQPYVASVDEEGERALIHLGGAYSHAINKGPLLTEHGRMTEGLWEPERISAVQPAGDERALARAVLRALPWAPEELLYARVDMVSGPDGSPLLLELELAEPSLFLAHCGGAAGRFASAIVTMMREGR